MQIEATLTGGTPGDSSAGRERCPFWVKWLLGGGAKPPIPQSCQASSPEPARLYNQSSCHSFSGFFSLSVAISSEEFLSAIHSSSFPAQPSKANPSAVSRHHPIHSPPPVYRPAVRSYPFLGQHPHSHPRRRRLLTHSFPLCTRWERKTSSDTSANEQDKSRQGHTLFFFTYLAAAATKKPKADDDRHYRLASAAPTHKLPRPTIHIFTTKRRSDLRASVRACIVTLNGLNRFVAKSY